MKIQVIDFETTSVDPEKCSPTEFASITYDIQTKARTDIFSTLIECHEAIPEEITELTGISAHTYEDEGWMTRPDFLNKFIDLSRKTELFCAYNADFDRRVLNQLLYDHQLAPIAKPEKWFDAMVDLPWPARLMRCRQLQHRALDIGLLMDTRAKHRALADVETICDVFDLYDMEAVLEYHKVPWIYVAAIVPAPWKDNGVGRDQAKAAGFGWEGAPGGDRKVPLKWVARFKQGADLPQFPFRTELLP